MKKVLLSVLTFLLLITSGLVQVSAKSDMKLTSGGKKVTVRAKGAFTIHVHYNCDPNQGRCVGYRELVAGEKATVEDTGPGPYIRIRALKGFGYKPFKFLSIDGESIVCTGTAFSPHCKNYPPSGNNFNLYK